MQRWKNRWLRRNAGARAALQTRPASADGTRRCSDCANFLRCPKERRAGNHVDCFVPYAMLLEQERRREEHKEVDQFAAVMGGILAISCVVLVLIFAIPYVLGI